jgi:GPH family glycoside/pentoside/hexuronide:cation symporter
MVKLFGGEVDPNAGPEAEAAASQTGFLISMGLFSLLAMFLWFGAFATTKERIKPPAAQESSIVKDVKSIVTNVPWLILFLLGLFTLSYVSIRNATAAYYIKYYVGEQSLFGTTLSVEALMGWFNGIGMLAAIAGTALLTTSMSKRLGKKMAYVILMGLSAGLTIIYYWLPPDAVITILVLQTLVSIFMGPTTPLVFAMYTDAVDYSEWKDGRRATGLVMSASGLAQSLGWTVGGMLGGVLLSYFDYEPNTDLSERTLFGIKSMISWIPAIGAALATLAMIVYPLSEKKMKEIVDELEARREAEKEESGESGQKEENGALKQKEDE